MSVRSLAFNAVRVVAALLALVLLLLTPAITQSPSGISYEPVGIVIDLIAAAVLIGVAWTVLRGRFVQAR